MEPIIAKVAHQLLPLELKFGQSPTHHPHFHNLCFDLLTPDTMLKDTYLGLQHLAESLDMDVARGCDCIPGFDKLHNEVCRLLDVSPWTMHPDYGCVTVAEARRRDSQS
jgi:hypothetical protein